MNENAIRLEIEEMIDDLVEEEHTLILEVINYQIQNGIDKNAKEDIYENSGIVNKIIKEDEKFNGKFEYDTEVMGYSISYNGTIEGTKKIIKNSDDINYEFEILLENIKIDGEKNVSIDFDILSNKNVIPEVILSKIENNISEILKNKLRQ